MSLAANNTINFVHEWIPVPIPQSAPTLLLLHGTGGNERDLLPLGRQLLPNANLLSPRGKVLERGMPRFFQRLAEGVFDQEDLRFRAAELAEFIAASAEAYGFDPNRLIAVGYSNGANIAASLLLRQPTVLAGAILLHPMTPFVPETLPDLRGKPIFIGAGRNDPIVPASDTTQLAQLLESAGANITLHWRSGGHALTPGEVESARQYVQSVPV